MSKAILCACALVLAAIGATAEAAVTLVRDGKAAAKIYVDGPLSEEVPKPEKGAPKFVPDAEVAARAEWVREINYHIQKMSGAELEVVVADDAKAIKGPAIVLGKLAGALGAKPGDGDDSDDAFRFIVKGDRVLIHGRGNDGTYFGVTELLRRLGCEWVMPGEIGEVIPKQSTVKIDDADVSASPDFSARRLWYRGYRTKEHPAKPEEGQRFAQWSRRQRAAGGSHVVGGTGGHVWDQFINRHKAEFDKDPTMLALRRDRNGEMKRMGPQLEPTHPRVIELFVNDIKETYRKNIEAGTWTRDTAAGFGIGPADGLGYSQSAESMLAGSGRIDPVVGEADQTDNLILMANRVLEAVHKEYPNAHVGFYSYSTHADYPARYQPDPKVGQIFAPINFSRYHSVLDANSKTQSYYRDVVERWGELSRKQGNPLLYRGYSWNLAENMAPYTKVRIWGEELPFYKSQGIVGLNVEGTKMWSILAASDWVFMRLAWDTELDWRALLREFCQKAYGKGAAEMERYHLKLIETQHAAGQEAGSYHALHLIFNDQWVADANAIIRKAMAAANTPEDKKRVEYTGLMPVEALRLYLAYHKATTQFDFAAVKSAYDAMRAHWDTCYAVNTDLVSNEAPAYMKRFLESFVTDGLTYSTGEYRIVEKLPDAMPTAFDPLLVGHRMNYHHPAVNDAGWVRTKTYTSTWDAQGLTGMRSGGVWYRHRFTLDKKMKGKPIGLFLGGMEDEGRVWINGHFIGTSGQVFSRPAVYDLTEGIHYDGENTVAIQVIRNSGANEIGLGGLLRPSFVFTGPRLEKKAPNQVELRRVLPGGELGGAEE